MSVTASMAMHVGGFFFFMHISQLGPKTTQKVISDVDLLIQVRRLAPAAQAKALPPPTMMSFLKMALPSIPKVEPRRMDVKLPEIKRPLLPQTAKLDDKGRMLQLSKMETIDLSKRRVDAAKIEAKLADSHRASLAALPRLEEVGMRRVKNLSAAIALEERRQDAIALQAIQKLEVASSRHAAGPADILREASPSQRSQLVEKIASFLPAAQESIVLQPRAAPEPPSMMKKLETASPAARRAGAGAMAEKKKSVEIEGPLADRRVVSYDIPEFPAWAKQQGIIEATVSIRFTVDREGNVRPEPDMRVEHTSGYGRLDRLAMESLRNWKFAPIATSDRQWGIITFRFLLE